MSGLSYDLDPPPPSREQQRQYYLAHPAAAAAKRKAANLISRRRAAATRVKKAFQKHNRKQLARKAKVTRKATKKYHQSAVKERNLKANKRASAIKAGLPAKVLKSKERTARAVKKACTAAGGEFKRKIVKSRSYCY
jgi:hypothetical protein